MKRDKLKLKYNAADNSFLFFLSVQEYNNSTIVQTVPKYKKKTTRRVEIKELLTVGKSITLRASTYVRTIRAIQAVIPWGNISYCIAKTDTQRANYSLYFTSNKQWKWPKHTGRDTLTTSIEENKCCAGNVHGISSTVEPRFNDMPRERSNYIVKPGYRYSRIPGITILWENF